MRKPRKSYEEIYCNSNVDLAEAGKFQTFFRLNGWYEHSDSWTWYFLQRLWPEEEYDHDDSHTPKKVTNSKRYIKSTFLLPSVYVCRSPCKSNHSVRPWKTFDEKHISMIYSKQKLHVQC